MKVVVCQGDPASGYPSREVLAEYWAETLKDVKEIDELVIRNRFNFEKEEEILEDADALLGLWIVDDYLNDEFFEKYPKLKYIASFAHGFGKIDKEAVDKHDVTVTNTVYGDVTIAQYAMALLLDICHGVRLQDKAYKEILDSGESFGFGKSKHIKVRQRELYGKTLGILGLGNIGLWMAKMASGFGMKVVGHSRTKKEGSEYDFIEQVSYDELLERSDVISIHCPLNESTRNKVDAQAISKMKDGVIIINTARGEIINEPDLVEALNSGKVYAAGLDVVCGEPITKRNELMDCENAIITPHVAWLPEEARYRVVDIASENLINWINDEPTSVII